MRPCLYSSHWSPISLVPQCDPDYTVLIGPPCHWSPNATLVMQFSLVPPSHWSPGSPVATLSNLFSLLPHLTGLPMQPFLFHSHYYTFINTFLVVPMIDRPLLLNRSSAFCFVLSCEHSYEGWHFT